MMEFIEENKTKAHIKVVGVGGCGGNAVNNMCTNLSMDEVAYYAVNTDAQALEKIAANCEKIQIGVGRDKGLGAGANYQLAEQAAKESDARIREVVEGADMIFVAAGMGGGTGTGAAPVVCEICRDLNILTVAVVTKPFDWENRDEQAEKGINNLSQHVDSLIVVPNDRVLEHFGDDVTMSELFDRSDEILINAVSGICEVIYKPGHINVDFADVRSVMSEMGKAMMGTAIESGPDRALTAAKKVIECPLLEGIDLSNARGLLVNISASKETLKAKEVHEAMGQIKKTASPDARVFFGIVYDDCMEDRMRVTLIATGLRRDSNLRTFNGGLNTSTENKVIKPPMMRSARFNQQQQQSLLGDSEPSILRKQLS